MIQLVRPECPTELTLKRVELTEEYKLTKKAVWKKSYITRPLQRMSNDKCCFCECRLGEEGKYMQVEHFHHKNDYEDEVVDWYNLLPICMRCNTHKRSHDTYKAPIIDPTIENPQEHLFLSNYRIKGKNDLGKLTISVLDLNDTEEIVTPRFRIATAVIEKLDDALEIAETYNPLSESSQEKSKLLRKVRSILKECGSKYPYSATVSTVILSNHSYGALKNILNSKELWTEEFEALEQAAKNVRLDVKS